MMLIKFITLTSSLLVFGVYLAAIEPQGIGLLRWYLHIPYGDIVVDEPVAYRFFAVTPEIDLRLTLSNTHVEPLVIPSEELRKAVNVRIDSETGTPITTKWLTGSANEVGCAGDVTIRIASNAGIECPIIVRRADGAVFPEGRWVLRVSIDLSSATNDLGAPWSGRLSTRLTGAAIVIRAPTTHQERVAAHRQSGRRAIGHNQLEQAVSAFRDAIAVEPTHALSLIDLGNTYLRLNRFAEAIEPLEKALSLTNDRDALGWPLALSYLATNDEQKAIQTLQRTGFPPERIADELSRMRRRLGRR